MNNCNNRIIPKKNIEEILNQGENEERIVVHNPLWYQRAFACQCFYEQLLEEGDVLTEKNQIFEKSNETLEIVGDSVIGSVVVEYLEERFCDQREGFISLLKTHLTKTQGLSDLAKSLNFPDWILLSTSSENLIVKNELNEEAIIGRNNPQFLENCFEAFVGALFTDYKKKYNAGKAYEACRSFVISVLEKYVDFSSLVLKGDNYKNLLQHYFHLRKWPLPTYEDLQTTTDECERMLYTRAIYIDRFLLSDDEIYLLINKFKNNNNLFRGSKVMIGLGISYKKKSADQLCAKNVLETFSPEDLELNLEIV